MSFQDEPLDVPMRLEEHRARVAARGSAAEELGRGALELARQLGIRTHHGEEAFERSIDLCGDVGHVPVSPEMRV